MVWSEVVELIDPDMLVSDEILVRIQKARLAFATLRHLWSQQGVCQSSKGRIK